MRKTFLVSRLNRTLVAITAIALTIAVAWWTLPHIAKTDKQGIRLPIVMYHSLMNNSAQWGKWTCSPDVLEEDLQYLAQAGYRAVTLEQVYAHLITGEPLPENPIVLTFDDGFMNNLVYGLPLLEKYDQCGVIFPVGAYVYDPPAGPRSADYSYCLPEELRELYESGRFEIGSHSYGMHRDGARYGMKRQRGESVAAYADALSADLIPYQQLLQRDVGVAPMSLAYPFGVVSNEADGVLRSLGFRATLTCYERVSVVAGVDDLFSLGRFNRPSGVSAAAFFKKVGI